MTTATTAELLTVPEVMARLKLGRSKVYDLIRSHRLVSIKIDGARRIPARLRQRLHPRPDRGGCLMATQRKRNPNGAGTITKRKDGRYQCAVYVLQPDGTRARKFAYGKTWEECDAKRRELLDKVASGTPVPTRSAKLSEWLSVLAGERREAAPQAQHVRQVRGARPALPLPDDRREAA